MKYPYPLRFTLPALLLAFGILLAVVFTMDQLRTSGIAIEEESLHHMESLGNSVSSRLEYDYQRVDPQAAQWRISLLGTEIHVRHGIVYDNAENVIAATDPAMLKST